jgi:N-acetyl sugar amidotransferase
MPNLSYRVCTRCVMDTTDPDIRFDEDGVCNHCHQHEHDLATQVDTGPEGRRQLEAIAEGLRREHQGKPYDCLIGVSGGVDSTYTAWLVKELGLRPLAVHLDNGWNSEIAVRNIARALDKLGIELNTHVIDWEEYKDIQRAFLRASVPDVEIPTDHAINALLVLTAEKLGVSAVLRGANYSTESHLPAAWSQGHADYGYIADVHKRFGTGKTKTFPRLGFMRYAGLVKTQVRTLDILNYVPYTRELALDVIENQLDWQSYGGKHHESVFTRWYQGYYLVRKFGFDKRKAHLSSLVSSGEITRDQALAALQQPPYDEELQQSDCEYVAKKLDLSPGEFEAIMTAAPKSFSDYNSYEKLMARRSVKALGQVRRSLRGAVSGKPAKAAAADRPPAQQ